MLIPRKSHSRVESHNSRVSIQTLDFTRVHTFYRHDRSWIAGRDAKGGGGRSPAGPQRCYQMMLGPHRSIDIAGGDAPKTSQNGRGGLQGSTTGEAQWMIGPRTTDRGIAVPHLPPPVRRRWTIGRRRGRIEKKDWDWRLSSLVNIPND